MSCTKMRSSGSFCPSVARSPTGLGALKVPCSAQCFCQRCSISAASAGEQRYGVWSDVSAGVFMVGHSSRRGNRLNRMIVLTILLVILALVVLTVGLLGFIEKLPGNGVVGLRIPEVRKSSENWVLAHKIAGPAWMGAGAALLGAALLTTGIGGWMWLVFALLIVGALFLIGMGSAMAASTMARLEHVRSQQEEDERAAAGCCSS